MRQRSATHSLFGHCVAYRAPASGGADWKHWILHDAQLGVFDASDTRAVNHKMWDGSLVYFVRLPVEEGLHARLLLWPRCVTKGSTLPPCSRRGDWRPSIRPSPCFRLCWTRLCPALVPPPPQARGPER